MWLFLIVMVLYDLYVVFMLNGSFRLMVELA